MKRTLLALMLLVPVVHAADDVEVARLTHLLTNVTEAHGAQVKAILEQQQRQINSKCTLSGLEADNLSILADPEFDVNAQPTHGVWAVTYKAKVCKAEVRRMVGFEADTKGLTIEAGPPGTTMADPVLAKDVWSSFQKAAVRQNGSCNPREMVLKDTQMVQAPSTATTSWREAWVAKVCGKEMGQIVHFYPTRAGTVFRMSLPEEDKRASKTATPSYQSVQ